MTELRLNDKLRSFLARANPKTFERKEMVAVLPISDSEKKGVVLLRKLNETGDTLLGDHITRQCTMFQGSFRFKRNGEKKTNV